jgi:hypothetical protein
VVAPFRDAAAELPQTGILGGLEIHHDAAILGDPVRPAFALQSGGRLRPHVRGLGLAGYTEQQCSSRMAEHCSAHVHHQIGILSAQHSAAVGLSLERCPCFLAGLGAAVKAIGGDDVVGIPFVQFEHMGVDCAADAHRWRRLGNDALRVDVARPVVQGRSRDEIQMRL